MRLRVGKVVQDVPNVWFTSDWHLNHANIIKYCNRPFHDADEMDNCLLDNCNDKVGEDDVLFYLGDWCFSRRENKRSLVLLADNYRTALRCRNVYFLFGNHDRKLRYEPAFLKMWRGTYDLLEIKVEEQSIILCHYALRAWHKSHHGSWHLFGHSHGGLADDPTALAFDVGTDCFSYGPIDFTTVKAVMAQRVQRGAGGWLHHEIGE